MTCRIATMLAVLAFTGCKPAPSTPAAQPVVQIPASREHAAVHDPANPPIDCPLRNQGVHTADMKPFQEVEKYIQFLERPDRAVWQKPDEVVSTLALRGDETVMDLGAGSGYFSFRFARVLPRGRVIAQDIEAEMIRHIHHKAMTEGINNIQVVLGKPDDPSVPAEADVVFICDVLHHVPDQPAWLKKVWTAMKPGARLVLIEFKEGSLPQGPPESAKIPRARLLELVKGAGFTLHTEHTNVLPYQVFLEFKKPTP